MANARSGRELAPLGNTAPPLDAAAPPPVHHDLAPRAPRAGALRARAPRAGVPGVGLPRAAAGHRAARPRDPRHPTDPRRPRVRENPAASALAWVPYLLVLAGAAAGMLVAWHGPNYAGRGAGLLGSSLIAAALARLILPARYAGLLSTRRKAFDVLAFAAFGAAVLAVALMLP